MTGGPADATRGEAFIDAISARFRLHEQCFSQRDAKPLATGFIAPDAVWDFQGFPRLQGREAVLGFFEQVVQNSTVAITPFSWRVESRSGWSLVDYVVHFETQEQPMTLRTMFVWALTDAGWFVEAAVGYKA